MHIFHDYTHEYIMRGCDEIKVSTCKTCGYKKESFNQKIHDFGKWEKVNSWETTNQITGEVVHTFDKVKRSCKRCGTVQHKRDYY